MKNIISICGKELYTYFVSPIAYFVFFVFIAVSGFLYSNALEYHSGIEGSGMAVMEFLFGIINFILLVFAPLLTMKLFAEERKSGTIELLLTSPVTDTEVVIGKFLASLSLLLIMLSLTLLFPILILSFGELDLGPLISGYLGILLLGSCCLSVGLMISSMSKNQVVSGLTSFGVLLTLWVIGQLSNRAMSNNSGWLGELLAHLSAFLAYLSLVTHVEDFVRGVVSLKDAVYYLSATAVFLFATVKSIESSKWR